MVLCNYAIIRSLVATMSLEEAVCALRDTKEAPSKLALLAMRIADITKIDGNVANGRLFRLLYCFICFLLNYWFVISSSVGDRDSFVRDEAAPQLC